MTVDCRTMVMYVQSMIPHLGVPIIANKVLTVPYGVYTFVRLLATADFHIRKVTFLLSIIIANINLPFNLSTTGCV